MTPVQKVKWEILDKVAQWEKGDPPPYPCENVDELFDKLVSDEGHYDAKNEIRHGTVETKLKCEFTRHYESKAVAMQMPDKTWVGWTFWYGGGKHGEPEAIDWMEEAYEVNCMEEQKMVTIQTFSKKDATE